MFIIACVATSVVTPIASKLPNMSGAFIEITIPLHTKIANNNMIVTQPTNPSSSATIANMKSFCGSGMYKYFCLLFPSPTPNKPPEPIAYKLCTI